MEWLPGLPLKEAFRHQEGNIIDALHIAIPAAGTLAEIHDHQIIHRDVTPGNLLVDLQNRKVHLIDFGISTNLRLRQPYVGNPERIEGTVAYISPEQTGRMNRAVDYRSDLYSLGVTIYEMLAGQLPFTGMDAVELVHAHLAETPPPLHEVNSAVPEVLSDIVARLLAKNADDRYQSARGLRHDLEQCLAACQRQGSRIAAFPLGQADYSGTFRLPQKLYGRTSEIAAIIRTFESSADNLRKLLLVGGHSGVGKTELVQEVYKPITARRGRFCSGKFDQWRRATPYFAFLQALHDLVDTLLTENDEQFQALRERLQEALGDEGRALTNVLPDLEHIVGEQPPLPKVNGAEAQNRFNYVFRKFIRVLATADHPLVIFIDDLQWADSASLDLLQVLMTDPESRHLLLICAYRTNETGPGHPFIQAVEQIRESGAEPEMIRLEGLTQTNLATMLSDALRFPSETVAPLAALVHEKTGGNAFFATEFLKSLADEGLLSFDAASTEWKWDARAIAERNIADNVVELMSGKVMRLKDETQTVLKLAACIGNRFDLDALCQITGAESGDLRARLKPALAEGLILPLEGGRFKFSHDRIQQAVYSLIPEDERQRVHLDIGRGLRKCLDGADDGAQVFDIASHLNLSRVLLDDEQEIIDLARINLVAGRRARQNSAFPSALEYLECGIALLQEGPDPWAAHYDLCLALFTEATEAAYLSGKFDRMDGWFCEILDRADHILEKVRPYEIRILAYKAENRFREAIETGLTVLDQLGEHIPRNPNAAHILQDFIRTGLALRGRSDEDLMSLPLMEVPEKQAAMRIIADITSSVYWGKPKLVPLIVFRMVRLSLRYGNHPVSCFAYGSYGVLLCGVLGRMRAGYRYGRLALKLLDKLNAKEWKAQIYVTPYALVFHWNEHIRNTLRPLQQSFQIGMETGLIEFACINTNIYCIHSFLCGRSLERIAEEARAYSDLYRQFKQETNLNYNEVFRQTMLNFMGQCADPVMLNGEAYDEGRMLEQNLQRGDETGTFFIHFNKLVLCYFFRRFEQAAYHAGEARGRLDAVLAKFEIPNHAFYEALTQLALAEGQKGAARLRLMMRARRNIARLKTWSRSAPENYRHKYDLCIAELARIQGRPQKARLAYDRAITGASENNFLHEQALAYELAGRFYTETGNQILAEFHLKAAYNTYREWGSAAKLEDLVDTFPKYLSQGVLALDGDTISTTVTSGIKGELLDIASLLKAATTISGEVEPANLLTVLMRIVLKNAGARRGFLLLDSAEGLLVQARGEEGGNRIEVMQAEPLDDSSGLAVSLVKFVHRTGKPVVISDAATDERVKEQPGWSDHPHKAILSVPIIKQGRRIGVLYLENDLTAGVFTRDRVDLLKLLSGQIAVSIDNAMLYEQLELKVAERTAELEQEKQKTDDLLRNILPAETAEELKQKGHADARQYDCVTVLFSDFEHFTELSARLSPADLVQEINECFRIFDHIAEKHRIEKIKTIGDAYMAAGGLPAPNSTHAADVVSAALEMRDFIERRNAAGAGHGMGIRIGVHTGPVVAGVVGLKKFQYDIWGDTVNTAARMENNGSAGRVNLSRSTYNLVRDLFAFEFRGEVEVKGKGIMTMYFVDHPSTSETGAKTDEHQTATH